MDKDWMPKVDLKKDAGRLNDIEIGLMKEVERQNSERVRQLRRIRKSNKIFGLTLGFTVVSIYLYTIYTVKQERFLDDFNEPDPIVEPQTYK